MMSRSGRLSMAASSSFPMLQPVVDQSCTMSKVVRHSKCTPALQASLCYDRLHRSLSTLCAMISLDPIQNLNRLQHLRPRPDVSSACAGDAHCANHVKWTRLLSLTSWKRARLCYRFSTPGWAGHLHLLTVGCFGLKRQTEHVVSTVFPQTQELPSQPDYAILYVPRTLLTISVKNEKCFPARLRAPLGLGINNCWIF
jgi:hypothetical protein